MSVCSYVLEHYEHLSTHVEVRDAHALLTMLKDNQLARVMKSIGYRYIHVGSWWTPTATSPLADVNVTFGGLSEFASVLYQTTALAPVATDDARHTE